MLRSLARRFVKVGNLTVVLANGWTGSFGDGTGPEVRARLKPGAALRIATRPTLALGECYMEGSLILEAGSFYDLLDLFGRNIPHDPGQGRYTAVRRAWFGLARRLAHLNGRRAARRNIAHHYDLSHDLYRRFLDADLQYSCAYFARPGMSLEQAQAAKKAHVAAKLRLRGGERMLDIGCGWGGLALTLGALSPGSQVLGVTVSDEQLEIARARAEAAGVSERVRFALRDYRDVAGPFDRIVSVGMFEHVGRPNYQAYFDTVARLLAEDGVAVIHSIGRRREPGVTNPFVAKYIFPGGYIPALSEVLEAVEKAGLWVTDVEVLRLHYAQTLREWRARFMAQRAEIAALYDERFCRMWEAYLALSEVAFRHGGFMVFQLQLTKRVDALPITRDYMAEAEAALTGGGAA